jgi:undecaprenyl-diphosphatase
MIKTIILGIVQGLTEFLPVSSSGHLAILENMLGMSEPMTLAVFLHFGTFVAIIVFFSRPLRDLIAGIFSGDRQSILYVGNIILGTIPIVIAAIFFRSWVTQAFDNIKVVAILLGITGTFVLLTGIVRKKQKKVTTTSAILIGIGQMLAILPGISRSGMTISAGMYSGTDPEQAFRFSFLLSIPAVLGANIFELRNLSGITNLPELLAGMFCSFISGIVALAILRRTVYKKFHFFGIYCLITSVALLIFL